MYADQVIDLELGWIFSGKASNSAEQYAQAISCCIQCKRVESEMMVKKTTAILLTLMFALFSNATTACDLHCMSCCFGVHDGAGPIVVGHHHGPVAEASHHSHCAQSTKNTIRTTHVTTISTSGLPTCCRQGDTTIIQCVSTTDQTVVAWKSVDKDATDANRKVTGTITVKAFFVSPPSNIGLNSFLAISDPLPLRI